MNRFHVLITLSTLLTVCWAVDVEVCDKPSSELQQVTISGCTDDDDVCPFNRGTNVTLNAQFESEITSKVANVKIRGIIDGIPFPFPLSPSDACGNYNLKCPLQPATNYDLIINLPILQSYPAWAVTVQLKLLDDKKKEIICLQFPAQIN